MEKIPPEGGEKMTEQEKDRLVDLNDVIIDDSLPEEEKIQSFKQQIHDPYRFRIGDAAVQVSYEDTDKTITDRVISMMDAIRDFR